MTVFTIESNSEETTLLLKQFVEEHGLLTTTNDHRVLTDDDMIFGFGRKATNAELREYLESTEENDEGTFYSIEEVRAKFSGK